MPELTPQIEFCKVGLNLSATINQANFLDDIRKNIVTIAHGPAGTGKTYLAIAEGFRLLMSKKSKTEKIIFVRPAVEAQEHLGFLPGDISEKIGPYMAPLWYNAKRILNGQFDSVKEKVEEMPIAYLRGITFENSYVVLDEAQNTTVEQMKLCLSRIGKGTKMVIVGDTKQTDIRCLSGLEDAIKRLKALEGHGVGFSELTYEDNMRSGIVDKILRVYDGFHPTDPRGKLENTIDAIFPDMSNINLE